ncbi:MAG: DUF1343 domain-containing protein [Bacilli bacterium]|nr:DUF1343 domain-containing protein [Bacilli bacterium]
MSRTILGIERVSEFKNIFENKRIGLITNPTGIDGNFKSSIDILREQTNLVGLFSPEHGVRASIQAGQHLETYIDDETGITVYSLYGKTRRPTKEMMDAVDVMTIDIQDVGSRYYTFIYTMAYCMQACKEYGKKFVVFDRPNPVNCEKVEGNILDLKYRSFVGYYPMPQRHGLTIGELALLFNKEYKIGCDLEVIPMLNYERSMSFEDTSLPWVIPSPNFPTINTAYAYNITCVLEGTNVAEGRGTTTPFELFGAPWMKSEVLSRQLNELNLPGVYFRPQYFTPTFSKYAGELCGGVYLHITDRNACHSIKTSWAILKVIRENYPEHFKINAPYVEGRPCMFEFETGCDYIRDMTYTLEEEWALLDKDEAEFKNIRKEYLIY